jgi:hypothetical protein
MAQNEYYNCWNFFSNCSLVTTREESANDEIPLWEEVETVISRQLRTITIEGRTGPQSFVIDDHKAHCEVNPTKHRNTNIKFIKHVADNRLGMVVDTLVCTTTLLVASLQVAIKGRKTHDNMRNQIYANAFGRDPFTPPDLHNIEFHGNRGYFSENAFIGILLLTGCVLTCTCPRGKWLSFVLGDVPMDDDDDRVVILEEGLMTCEVRASQLTE